MKRFLPILICLFFIQDLCAQAKKPIIMVMPSRQWCISKGYYTSFDRGGVMEKDPDYQRVFDENPDMLLVISRINTLFTDRGFPLKDLSQNISSIRTVSAEDAALSLDRESAGKGALAESNFDKIRNRAKADIIIELQWTVNKQGPQQSITYIMRGLDAYSDKQIAGSEGTGKPSISSPAPVMLEEAVLAHIDNFNSRLQSYFDDLFANGREIKLELRRDANWSDDFETDVKGEELSQLIEDWVGKNTVKGRFTTDDATENKIVFSQVRIPMFDANQRAIDARAFGRNLQRYLKTLGVEAKVVTRGLGYVTLICGK
jgi:hypothetical protein